MSGTFGGLELALTALRADRQAMDVTGQNIANAQTPGYARQEPVFVDLSGPQESNLGINAGSGVVLSTIERVHSTFLSSQNELGLASVAYQTSMSQSLSQLQSMYASTSSADLGSALDKLWQTFSALANNPENSATRAEVLAQGQNLAGTIQTLYSSLTGMQQNLDSAIVGQVSQINALAAQVGTLNGEIESATSAGTNANNLIDQRRSVLNQLATLVGARSTPLAHGGTDVYVGNLPLVQNTNVQPLSTVPNGANPNFHDLSLGPNLPAPTVTSGTLGAELQTRDQVIGTQLNALQSFTSALVSAINTQHAAGYGLNGTSGLPFFTVGSNPSDISVNNTLIANPNDLAASASGQSGDGQNAQALANIENQPEVSGQTLDGYYQSVVGQLAVEAQNANTSLTRSQDLQTALANQISSVSGISSDQEATLLLEYEHSYQAAAEFSKTYNNMLSTLLNTL